MLNPLLTNERLCSSDPTQQVLVTLARAATNPDEKLQALRRVHPIVRHITAGRSAAAAPVGLDALRTELPLRVALPVTWRWKNSRVHWRERGAAPPQSPRFSAGSSVAE